MVRSEYKKVKMEAGFSVLTWMIFGSKLISNPRQYSAGAFLGARPREEVRSKSSQKSEEHPATKFGGQIMMKDGRTAHHPFSQLDGVSNQKSVIT
jgi:hypothetical protein